MTLSELKQRTRTYMQDEGATRITDKQIVEVANSVLRYYWQKIRTRNPDWTQRSASLVTVIDSDTITTGFPTDYGSAIRLEYTSDRVHLNKWLWPGNDAITAAGKPRDYRVEKCKIVFRQKSDAVYNMILWYDSVVATMSADTDIHGLPEYFDEVIIQRVALMMGSKFIEPTLFREQETVMINAVGVSGIEVQFTDIPITITNTGDALTS